MAEFVPAYKYTNLNEAGYVHHPSDKGGETWDGISRVNWPNEPIWNIIDKKKRQPGFPDNLDRKELEPYKEYFYRTKFWDKLNGDNIPDQEIAEMLFDAGVNMGWQSVARYLQRSLNLLNRGQRDYPDIVEDGLIGRNTLRILSIYLAKRGTLGKYVIIAYTMAQQMNRWIKLAVDSEDQEDFANGWGKRYISTIKLFADKYYGVKQ